MSEELSWDDPVIDADEEVTEKDIKDAESMGKKPCGKYLCVCVESKPRQADMKDYSCLAAKLKWEIEQVVELKNADGKWEKPDDEDAEELIGGFLWDDIMLPSPHEKNGFKNRRILVAKRTGLIDNAADRITTTMWASEIIGKRAVLTYDDSYNKKTDKTYRQVAFDGYDYADKVQSQEVTEDDIADI